MGTSTTLTFSPDRFFSPNFPVRRVARKTSPEDSSKLNLGYLDQASININGWKDHEGDGILYVPKAGGSLCRLKTA